MNNLLNHWKIDTNLINSINIKESKGNKEINKLVKLNNSNIKLFVKSVVNGNNGSSINLKDNNKLYPLIKVEKEEINIFNLNEIINGLLSEIYYVKKRPLFGFLPFPYTKIPVPIRLWLFKQFMKFKKDPLFPAWPIERSVETLRELFMQSLVMASGKPLDYIHFWPKKDFALMLTHDCDSESSFKWIEYIREIEKKYGFTSSWNFVPKQYKLEFDKLDFLKKEKCEIGIHDYDHTANFPYCKSEDIRNKLKESIKIFNKYNPRGFRSAQLQRSPKFLNILSEYFKYDTSIPDTDIYSPVQFRNGACTVFPFFINKMVELPLTMPQDFRLKRMGKSSNQIFEMWKEKLEYIKNQNGLVNINIHPDDFIFGNEKWLNAYDKFLKYAEKTNNWNVNPHEIASWWQERDRAILKDGKIKGSKRARIKAHN